MKMATHCASFLKHKWTVISVSGIIFFGGAAVCLTIGLKTKDLMARSEGLQMAMECFRSMKSGDEFRRDCQSVDLRTLISPETSKRCLKDAGFRRVISSMVTNQTRTVSGNLEGMKASMLASKRLKTACNAHHQSPRIIVHWFINRSEKNANSTWKVTSYERHRSIYTVSSGPDGVYENGEIHITETGLYYLYVKMTFTCQVADFKRRHVSLEVDVETPSSDRSDTVLRGDERTRCEARGDVATVFQRGLFRLTEHSRLVLKYKVPENVTLATGGSAAFKSYFGMYKVRDERYMKAAGALEHLME